MSELGGAIKGISDYSDERHKNWCIHCGSVLSAVDSNLDHVPSKCILDKPFPENLPTVRICSPCNSSFSNDEEYFIAFLEAVHPREIDLGQQGARRAERVLSNNIRLQDEIVEQIKLEKDADGNDRVAIAPDITRIHNVVVKNARGHIMYEHGTPAFGEPTSIAVLPLSTLSSEARRIFEVIDYGSVWPEVGSRLMSRLVSGKGMLSDGWVIVQPNIYRFAVIDNGRLVVRTVVHEFLATETIWEY